MQLYEQLIAANCYYNKIDHLIGEVYDESDLIVIVFCEGMLAEIMMDAIPTILSFFPKSIILQGANADEMLVHFEEEIFLLESAGDDDIADPSITTHNSIEEALYYALNTIKVKIYKKTVIVWDYNGTQKEKLEKIELHKLLT